MPRALEPTIWGDSGSLTGCPRTTSDVLPHLQRYPDCLHNYPDILISHNLPTAHPHSHLNILISAEQLPFLRLSQGPVLTFVEKFGPKHCSMSLVFDCSRTASIAEDSCVLPPRECLSIPDRPTHVSFFGSVTCEVPEFLFLLTRLNLAAMYRSSALFRAEELGVIHVQPKAALCWSTLPQRILSSRSPLLPTGEVHTEFWALDF